MRKLKKSLLAQETDGVLEITKKEQARINKNRGKAMEHRIAKLLKGNRVMMSGAGSIKGDCIIPFDEHRTYYVECKLTARKDGRTLFTIPHEWFYKIDRESYAMRSVFGILVIHWHNLKEDWVFIRQDKIHFIEELKDVSLQHWITPLKETGEMKKVKITANYERSNFLKGQRAYLIPDNERNKGGIWIVVNMKDWIDVLHKGN